MPSLLDIARGLRTTVRVGDHDLAVRGLTAEEIAELARMFPELQMFLGGRRGDIDLKGLKERAPEGVAWIIATALAPPKEKAQSEQLDGASELPGAVVTDLLMAIAELSLPRALLRPFVEVFTELAGSLSGAVAASGKDQATR